MIVKFKKAAKDDQKRQVHKKRNSKKLKEFKKLGYSTAVIGKWHLHIEPSAFDYYKVLKGQGNYFNPSFYESGQEVMDTLEGHSTDCITDLALSWLG